MTQIVRESSARESSVPLKPLSPDLNPVVLTWANELRGLFHATGLSINRFVLLHPHVDKGTVSRYLNGKRVPRERWFLDRLMDAQAQAGRPLTPAVREHLVDLQMRALGAAHPHEYKIRRATDELELAVASQREAERQARTLEKRLAERIRQVEQLTTEKARLRNAWARDRAHSQAVFRRLKQEIIDLSARLDTARERGHQAERRCQQLEDALHHLEASRQPDEHDAPKAIESGGFISTDIAARVLALAQQTADQAIADARREADHILDRARARALETAQSPDAPGGDQ